MQVPNSRVVALAVRGMRMDVVSITFLQGGCHVHMHSKHVAVTLMSIQSNIAVMKLFAYVKGHCMRPLSMWTAWDLRPGLSASPSCGCPGRPHRVKALSVWVPSFREPMTGPS